MCRLQQVCWLCLLGILLLNISVTKAYAGSKLVLSSQNTSVSAANVVEYLEDPSLNLKIDQVTQPIYAKAFKPNNQKQLSFGRSQSGGLSSRFKIKQT